MKELIACRADVTARTPLGDRTAMHWAALNGHVDVVQELINGDAAARAKDLQGGIPMDFAIAAGSLFSYSKVADGAKAVRAVPSCMRGRLPSPRVTRRTGRFQAVLLQEGEGGPSVCARQARRQEVKDAQAGAGCRTQRRLQQSAAVGRFGLGRGTCVSQGWGLLFLGDFSMKFLLACLNADV